MQIRGVNYDTGIETFAELPSRPNWNPEIVKQEIDIIANDLNCNAIRIYGDCLERLVFTSECALKNKMQVWFSPNRPNLDASSTLDFIKESACAAEKLRKQSPNVVMVVGSETSLFMKGIIPGETSQDRLALLTNPDHPKWSTIEFDSLSKQFNQFLDQAVRISKTEFNGPLSYAAAAWEDVDWSLFDYVGLDTYRDINTRQTFVEFLRLAKRFGKPIVATEFGCCTFHGARDKGAWGWTVADRRQNRILTPVQRDENEQSEELVEVLKIFESEKLAGAFVFTFVAPAYPHRSNPEHDLDMASYSIVKTLDEDSTNGYDGLPWEPKQAFYEIARQYSLKTSFS